MSFGNLFSNFKFGDDDNLTTIIIIVLIFWVFNCSGNNGFNLFGMNNCCEPVDCCCERKRHKKHHDCCDPCCRSGFGGFGGFGGGQNDWSIIILLIIVCFLMGDSDNCEVC